MPWYTKDPNRLSNRLEPPIKTMLYLTHCWTHKGFLSFYIKLLHSLMQRWDLDVRRAIVSSICWTGAPGSSGTEAFDLKKPGVKNIRQIKTPSPGTLSKLPINRNNDFKGGYRRNMREIHLKNTWLKKYSRLCGLVFLETWYQLGVF